MQVSPELLAVRVAQTGLPSRTRERGQRKERNEEQPPPVRSRRKQPGPRNRPNRPSTNWRDCRDDVPRLRQTKLEKAPAAPASLGLVARAVQRAHPRRERHPANERRFPPHGCCQTREKSPKDRESAPRHRHGDESPNFCEQIQTARGREALLCHRAPATRAVPGSVRPRRPAPDWRQDRRR